MLDISGVYGMLDRGYLIMRHYLLVGIFFKMATNESRFGVFILLAELNKWRKMPLYEVQKHKQTLM